MTGPHLYTRVWVPGIADGRYRPTCSCGWSGAAHVTPAAARRSWKDHLLRDGAR